MKEKNDTLGAYLVIAILLIIGLVWFIVDKRDDSTAPCSKDYVSQYGSQDCQDYQTQQDQQSDYKDCGFKPTC